MRSIPMTAVAAGLLLALGACGSTDTMRATTGGVGGAAAGGAVAGPVGAVVGGVGGAVAGNRMDEGAEEKIGEWTEGDRAGSGSTGMGPATAATGGDEPGLSRQRVRDVQQALNQTGYDLAVDGIWGPNTRNALRRFQQEQGLEATGQLDRRTAAALNLDTMR